MERIIQLVTVLLIFVFVLFITFFTTRWVAGFAKKTTYNKNIEVVESYRIAPNKFIAIVRTGSKYLVLGIGKDEVSMLAELDKESIDFSSDSTLQNFDFSNIIEKAKEKLGKNKDGSI